jgi:hypothetical protein
MAEHEASRTLVKSTPELWAECSDAASLARHLGRFGEIRITKLEPETAVAWEGDDVSGTVTLEPSGWGTRVTLTASADASPASEADSPPEPEAEPEPEPELELELALGRSAAPEPEDELLDPEAELPEPEDELPEPEDELPEPLAEPVAEEQSESVPTQSFLGRLLSRWRRETPAVEPDENSSDAESTTPDPQTHAPDPASADATPSRDEGGSRAPVRELAPQASALVEALESLGSAHRRPFSRG